MSIIIIGAVLTQYSRPIAYYNEALKGCHQSFHEQKRNVGHLLSLSINGNHIYWASLLQCAWIRKV